MSSILASDRLDRVTSINNHGLLVTIESPPATIAVAYLKLTYGQYGKSVIDGTLTRQAR